MNMKLIIELVILLSLIQSGISAQADVTCQTACYIQELTCASDDKCKIYLNACLVYPNSKTNCLCLFSETQNIGSCYNNCLQQKSDQLSNKYCVYSTDCQTELNQCVKDCPNCKALVKTCQFNDLNCLYCNQITRDYAQCLINKYIDIPLLWIPSPSCSEPGSINNNNNDILGSIINNNNLGGGDVNYNNGGINNNNNLGGGNTNHNNGGINNNNNFGGNTNYNKGGINNNNNYPYSTCYGSKNSNDS